MIRKLQRKFVLIAMVSIFAVMIVVIGSINIINFYQMNQRVDSILTLLSENDGKFPDHQNDVKPNPQQSFGNNMTPETKFETRYFLVQANSEKTLTKIDTGHIAAISSDQAKKYAEEVLSNNKTKGYINNYKYMVSSQSYGTLIVFVDCQSQIATCISFLLISCGIAVLSQILMFILVYFLSKMATRPFIESMEKQKQFITDAGHEIKTPLAIISANTDVLELTNGKSEWTDSIRNQISRLNELVKNLLVLSKMEEEKVQLEFSPFSLSDAVKESAEPFKTMAEMKKQKFFLDIQPEIMFNGNESGIRQLVSILVDNAVKYANEQGEIKISLHSSGKSAKLSVYNTCNEVPAGSMDKLFDRFYRADLSRARETGGYGIGLSIAKAIVETHKGKITAKAENANAMSFTVTL